jgi:hypothetical protein
MPRLRFHSRIEFFFVDHKAFMTALRDQIHTIVCLDGEDELLSFNGDQFDRGGDFKTRRCGGLMADVDMRSNRLFLRPIEVWVDGLDTRLLQKADEKARGKYLRHRDKLFRLGIKRRNRFGHRHFELVHVSDAGLERFFHVVIESECRPTIESKDIDAAAQRHTQLLLHHLPVLILDCGRAANDHRGER